MRVLKKKVQKRNYQDWLKQKQYYINLLKFRERRKKSIKNFKKKMKKLELIRGY